MKKLDISDNALRYLPALLVGRWDMLEELDLMNNEWSCDCENQYLVRSPTIAERNEPLRLTRREFLAGEVSNVIRENFVSP